MNSEQTFSRVFLRTSLAFLLFCLGAEIRAQVVPDIDDVDTSIVSITGIDIAAQSLPLVRVDHDAVAIDVDGILDEAIWQDVPAYSELKVTEPDTLDSPVYMTDLRLFYTELGLYMSFDMEQPADTLVKRFSVRDRSQMIRDSVAVSLDMSGEGRYGYWVSLALGDNQADGTILPERQYRSEWDAAWTGATATTDTGWSAEFFVPWSQMAMPKNQDQRQIGIYVSRKVAHLNEKWAWPPLPNSQPRFMTALQPMTLDRINPQQQWSFFPYASATYDRIDADVEYRVGADLFWRPTTNFQLTSALNPDFGTVEADDVTVNLTADETFFPEKRLFFQEGQEIFNTTPRADDPVRPPFTIINTRRIGGRPDLPDIPDDVVLSDRELLKIADLEGAVKATGQIGRFRFGTLAAFEDTTHYRASDTDFSQSGRDFGAVRLIYEDDVAASYRGLGFISTLVDHESGEARVNGLDFHFLSEEGFLNIDGQILQSDLPDAGTGRGAFVDIGLSPRQGLQHTIALTHFDDRIDVNDFGFQRRNDMSEIYYKLSWTRSDLRFVRDFVIEPGLTYEFNGDGRTTTALAEVDIASTLNNLSFVNLYFAYEPRTYDDRNSFGNGTFRVEPRYTLFGHYSVDVGDAISYFANVSSESEALGDQTHAITAGVTWRPTSQITVELQSRYVNYDDWLLHQEDQNFTTFQAEQWEPQLSFEYFPAAKQHFQIALQWIALKAVENDFYFLPPQTTELVAVDKPPGPSDNFSVSQLSFQVRYRWQIAPLSDLFVVYTKADDRVSELRSFSQLFRDSWNKPIGDQLVVKLRYRFGS